MAERRRFEIAFDGTTSEGAGRDGGCVSLPHPARRQAQRQPDRGRDQQDRGECTEIPCREGPRQQPKIYRALIPMRLYSGMSEDFIRDTTRNRIAERLRDAFFAYYRYNPSPAEINSWRNSLRAMTDVLDIAS